MSRFSGAQMRAALLAVAVVVPRLGHATIIDVGDVVVTPDNTLVVGVSQFGSRTIDGVADGPYAGIIVAREIGSSGQLTLRSAASLATTGLLNLGRGSAIEANQTASLAVLDGSLLTSVGTAIGDNGTPFAVAQVSGTGSRWINNGPLEVVHPLSRITLDILDGGQMYTQGLDLSHTWGGSITLAGAAAQLINEGETLIGGQGIRVEIRDGASMTDHGSTISASYGTSSLIVRGAGSEWNTGFVTLGAAISNVGLTSPAVSCLEGARISSGTVMPFSETFAGGSVDGAGSIWNIDGDLVLPTHGAGGSNFFDVTNGGLLTSHYGSIYNGNAAGVVRVLGPGSQWIMSNDFTLGTGIGRNELLIGGGGHVSNLDARIYGCNREPENGDPPDTWSHCIVAVSDPGSMWTVRGSLYIAGDELSYTFRPASLAISSGATAVINEAATVWDHGTIDLDSGTLDATQVNIRGGTIRGTGHIQGDILNEGLVEVADVMDIHGAYSQPTAGSLRLDMFSDRQGLLKITGSTFLGGELRIDLDATFSPPMGSMLTLITWPSRSGSFSSIEVTGGNGSFYLRPIYAQTKLMALVASCDTPGDTDCDGVLDAADKCPFIAGDDQGADTDHDGRGNACECTDQNGDGRNTVSDLLAINTAIFNPSLASPLCDGNNDGLCNVNDIIAGNIEIFSPGNTSTCARQPVPGP